jgi:CBS domain containing-hemolysin-like protein
MSSDVWLIVSVAVLVLVAAFFAGAETALTRISKVDAITLEEEGRRWAKQLGRLVEHPERFLNPVLLLMLLTHLVIATIVGILVERHYGAQWAILATAIETAVIFVIAEAAPKTWAIQHPDRSALLSTPIVYAVVSFLPIRVVTRGLISVTNAIIPGRGPRAGPFVSEQKLLAMADEAEEQDVIEEQERALIHSIIHFGDTVVREVMVPRPDMVSVEARARVKDVMEVAIQAGFSRIPVYEQGIDDIAGVVYAKDLMRSVSEGRADDPVRGLAREAIFVPETKRVAELMREMQARKFHMALVVDEYGGTAGLVTLEDLIEELVGEIVDEYDVEEPPVESLAGGDVRVNARMPIDELNELLDTELPEGDWDTVGGLVYNLLGHVPVEGETVECDGHRLRAEKVQGRRIGRVRITRLATAERGQEPA